MYVHIYLGEGYCVKWMDGALARWIMRKSPVGEREAASWKDSSAARSEGRDGSGGVPGMVYDVCSWFLVAGVGGFGICS